MSQQAQHTWRKQTQNALWTKLHRIHTVPFKNVETVTHIPLFQLYTQCIWVWHNKMSIRQKIDISASVSKCLLDMIHSSEEAHSVWTHILLWWYECSPKHAWPSTQLLIAHLLDAIKPANWFPLLVFLRAARFSCWPTSFKSSCSSKKSNHIFFAILIPWSSTSPDQHGVLHLMASHLCSINCNKSTNHLKTCWLAVT